MIPQLQMHPPSSPSTARHPHRRYRAISASGPSTPRYRASDSGPEFLSFPIRTSQHGGSFSTRTQYPAYTQGSEHRLRRKTPNGTIEAAYDASPPWRIDGPPPYKQIALSSSSLLSSDSSNTPVQPFDIGLQAPDLALLVPRGASSNGWASTWSWHSCPEPCPSLDSDVVRTRSWGTPPGMPAANPHNTVQPVLRANEYNVRAFCPPPMPSAPTLPFGQPEWPAAHWHTDWGHPSLADSLVNTPYMPSLANTSQFPGYTPPSDGAWLAQGWAHPETVLHQQMSATGRPFGQTHPHANTVHVLPQTGFRDKVLAQAHVHYMELLSYMQASRRSGQSQDGQADRKAVKPFLYPKPPNPSYRVPIHGRKSAKSSASTLSYGDHFAIPNCVVSDAPHIKHASSSAGVDLDSRSSLQNEPWKVVPCQQSELTNRSPAPIEVDPISTASSSLNLITNLCEQSNWKWLEGMLLGGCLLYGLERYGEALKWFSSILSSDLCHVEALTNAAAALYCLGRQHEAEQHWLRAVRTRPAYLEAAEHLVGLLYRRRSKDAVQVISFVQQALKIRPPETLRPSQHDDATKETAAPLVNQQLFCSSANHQTVPTPDYQPGTRATDFGSSGYALADRENGRILALVHAKATLLYGLKDVNGAAEAFEEAVLISVGRDMQDVHHLVGCIQAVLRSSEHTRRSYDPDFKATQPLLLTPERARRTSRLLFPSSGDLPGLRLVLDGHSKRAAIQTTSNSLLSLAKILQDAISHGGAAPSLVTRPSGIGDILALYYLSLSLQESPSTANNVGILLAGVQPELSTPVTTDSEKLRHPTIPGVPPGSGLAMALSYYQYGLKLDPKHVHLHTNFGSLLKDIGQLDLAIQMYEQAVSCDNTFDIALTNLANAVKDRGRIQDAISYYRRAVQSNPNFAEAVCGLFTALNSVCDWRGRGGIILPDRSYDRWHVGEDGTLIDAHVQPQSRGLALRVREIVTSQLQEASQWGMHTIDDHSTDELLGQFSDLSQGEREILIKALRKWAGKPWEGSRLVRLVERTCRVLQRRSYLAQQQAKLSGSSSQQCVPPQRSQYRRPRLPLSLTVPPAPTILPFHTFTCPLTPGDVRAISQRNAVRISCSTLRATWLPKHIYPAPPAPSPVLNVGYISSDFNNHPLAHLMQSVFGFHNPLRVKAYCYATTRSDYSSHRIKIETEAPVFRDVSTWSPGRLADQISQDNIHVLVNLNGYTRGARNEIFAARPAPIQMSFMGFAGSLGAEWCDYLLADLTAVPPETLRPWRANTELSDLLVDDSESSDGDWIYSENVIFCRDTFFCCDHAQSADEAEHSVTWETEQKRRWAMRKSLFPTLNDDMIILGNFNQLYKIEPTTFRTWLRILDKVPKAVLWLLRFPEPGEHYLQSTARVWAGDAVANRLIFTDVAPKSQHISRARVCDLFLDTPECNAHTTAADVLWSSTPLLTLPRYPYKMCSRMAASILRGALPKNDAGEAAAQDLIASCEENYEASAVTLAAGLTYDTANGVVRGAGRLAELRKLLWDSKWTCGLFDTRRWVADVEDAYEEAWRRWAEGKSGDIYL